MNTIIKVENLGKKYTIRHEHPEKYTALRDVITQQAKNLFSFPKHLRSSDNKKDQEDFWALKNINFEINPGDRIGIIGRNGAGKSTLLKLLSRITEPTTGRIELNGRVASLLEIGTGFHPELSGRENVYLNGAILGMSRAETRKKFDEIIDFAGVEKFLDTPVKRYSSGMYVRLAFAVAANLEPEILVVDEVLAVGDIEFQNKCIGKMNEVSRKEGRTVLFVSHNMGTISQLCNKGILLHNGKILQQEKIEIILDSYAGLEKNITEKYLNAKSEEFQIISVNVLNDKGIPSYSHSDEINVKIEVQVPYKISGLRLGLALKDKWKRKIFTTQYKIKDDEFGNEIITKTIIIPSRLLLGGLYSIDVASFIPNAITYTYLEDICPFNVQDFESDLAIYTNGEVGIININCNWL
jgi:lipopolysaccharide transport system ATP-binding protein